MSLMIEENLFVVEADVTLDKEAISVTLDFSQTLNR